MRKFYLALGQICLYRFDVGFRGLALQSSVLGLVSGSISMSHWTHSLQLPQQGCGDFTRLKLGI